jgi:F-type H+-transporting ATPase subunit b
MGNVLSIASDTAIAIVERLTGKAPSAQTIDAALDNVKA